MSYKYHVITFGCHPELDFIIIQSVQGRDE